ncbi:MAG: DNA repair protein RecN [Selenomonadaceae bacterium]|nr:DNA repair protein RecN [Selenomonadaceae bacterium]
MLKSLTVWNFALLEQVRVEFDQGLNILTGETGAGKSILIDALGAVLGGRLSTEAIRTGAEWLRVEGVFAPGENSPVRRLMEEQAIDEGDGTLIIVRQITKAGRSSVLVNGCHVTLAVLKRLGRELIDIHGQNENLSLLKETTQFKLLDNSDAAIAEALTAYRAQYETWSAKVQELKGREASAAENAQRLDMLNWQDKEISEAKLKEKEDEELAADIRRLSHGEKIVGSVQDAHRLLEGMGRDGGVMTSLSQIKKDLEEVSRFDDGLNNSLKMVSEAAVMLQEASYEIRDYGEGLDFDPQKLDALQARMDVIYKLGKKYGATVADILKHHQKVREELAALENYDEDIAALKEEVKVAATNLAAKAEKLTDARTKAAQKLSAALGSELKSLGMPKAKLSLALTPLKDFSVSGRDELTINFSANPGEAPKPLQKVASGGELSRIALAVKSVSAAQGDGADAMVFDEIDTGIGGRTAQMVAERIATVAKYKQVLCITHLPQIACMADVHLYIAKTSQGDKTTTQVARLTESMAVSEIARMASGADATAASLDNAREMLSHAKMFKGRNIKKAPS